MIFVQPSLVADCSVAVLWSCSGAITNVAPFCCLRDTTAERLHGLWANGPQPMLLLPPLT